MIDQKVGLRHDLNMDVTESSEGGVNEGRFAKDCVNVVDTDDDDDDDDDAAPGG